MPQLGLHIAAWLTALAGALANTSIGELLGKDVPFFYLIFLYAPFVLLVRAYQGRRIPPDVKRTAATLVVAILVLSIAFMAQTIFGIGDLQKNATQFISKALFLAYGLTLLLLLSERALFNATLSAFDVCLKLLILYGFYEFLSFFYGLPLFLEALRNNDSYNLSPAATTGTGGWLDFGLPRITSVFAEPSFSALPLAYFVLRQLFPLQRSSWSTVAWALLAVIYAALTLSRTVWIAVLVSILLATGTWTFRLLLVRAKPPLLAFSVSATKLLFLLLIFVIAGIAWPFLAPGAFDDLSALGRSTSVIIGLDLFLEHPLLGTGLNSYADVVHHSAIATVAQGTDEPLVHNYFVAYAQQMGVFGIALALLPLLAYVRSRAQHTAPAQAFVIAVTLVASFGTDPFYFSFTWLAMTLLCHFDRSVAPFLRDTAPAPPVLLPSSPPR